MVCIITNNTGVHTGTWCPLLSLGTRSRPWTQAPAQLPYCSMGSWKKHVFTLILVPYEYHTRVPFQVWMLSKKLLRYYPQTWVLWRTKLSQFKVGVFLAGSSYSSTTLLRGGGGEKASFSLLKLATCQKSPLRHSDSTFVADWRIKRTTKYYSLFQEC